MLQHLRFHRRAPSNPTSPIPETSPWDTASAQLVPNDGVPSPDPRPHSSTSLPFAHPHGQSPSQPAPPTLPPITSFVPPHSSDLAIDLTDFDSDSKPYDEPKPPYRSPRSSHKEETGFIGGLALHNYRREKEAKKPASSERTTATTPDGSTLKPNPPPVTNPPSRPPPLRSSKTTSFVSPTDLQNATATGKRAPGTRMTSEPQVLSNQPAFQEPPRGRKSLPFLKNPVSTLLLRRKAYQNVPDLALPLRNKSEEPSYDPRIRGTRVHDFSAPRPRRVVSSIEPTTTSFGADKPRQSYNPPVPSTQAPIVEAPPVPPKDEQTTSMHASSSTHSRSFSVGSGPTMKSQDSISSQSRTDSYSKSNSQRRKSSIQPSLASVSRNVSQASSKDVLSSLPRHMKSTSSRFSFDMIGAAKQEKLLEERHRQRQQDKKIDESMDRRDSRFDDFDEDAFDYDAMDFDDGLEERIPGVNADDDDEEGFDAVDDPDNDQENFAGFVFQRSNPGSSITSPHSAGMLPTPRDANGDIIGYATTAETPDLNRLSLGSPEESNERPPEKTTHNNSTTGLGIQIQGLLETVAEAPEPSMYQHANQHVGLMMKTHKQYGDVPKPTDKDDELYFDDGLIHDFDGEGDGSTFDESIFDLDDTDQYGRPIPGLFANTLAQRNAAQEAKKRESDLTSRLSGQSVLSKSTAHTSLSVDVQAKPEQPAVQKPEEQETKHLETAPPAAPPADLPLSNTGEDQVAAYQAALAAAAHQAAASGKFRRDSSSPPPAQLTITSPTTSGSSQPHSHPDENDNTFDNAIDDYDYDGFSAGLDDYELDDDAIIAEANASALANDSDGWYGQEFGFYSAPVPQYVHHGPNPLSEKNLYQYSHGGYFGPSGVNRSTSGRVVSREPNLTPITERSEYSNRNSLMSLGMPPGPSSAPVQSPGLAQLAMMADDDNMSLSALLRLRSKAWGGSQASLPSSRDGSPNDRNGATSPWGQDIGGIMGPSHGRKNSAFSIYSQESTTGPGSASGSPTLTMSMPNIPNNAIPPLNVPGSSNSASTASPISAPVFSPLQSSSACPPVFEDDETSPVEFTNTSAKPRGGSMSPTVGIPSQKKPGMGHRHRGSADSFSYSKEEESGETRWILERRRTAESGEIEILGREIVESGRI
ncbi:hypothetical protein F4809DRAFT_613018 [Biscogniauxia mediterranea]|nr:hypothetical protein F4809DRAFT_613018 [Biscogniauxia mediterranea]